MRVDRMSSKARRRIGAFVAGYAITSLITLLPYMWRGIRNTLLIRDLGWLWADFKEKTRTNLWQAIGNRLPRSLVYWALIRAWVHGTGGRWSDSVISEVKMEDIVMRWDPASYANGNIPSAVFDLTQLDIPVQSIQLSLYVDPPLILREDEAVHVSLRVGPKDPFGTEIPND